MKGVLLFFVAVCAIHALGQGTVFTYQGALNDAGGRASGVYDFKFTLYDSTNQPGNAVAGSITNEGVTVTNGWFAASLDFGAVFNGDARWLEIGVRTNGAENFVTLNPRQPLTPAPYAIFSGSATNLLGPLSGANLAPVANLIANTSNGLSSSFSTNLAAMTNVIREELTNSAAPFRGVLNVKAAPFNAVGDGVTDDWAAIQTAITTACLTTNGPTAVYIPAGTYRLTKTLALTTQTNAAIGTTGNISLSELFGDGGRRSVLNFTMTGANGLEFRVLNGDPRHLSNFTMHDLALIGPAVSGNTNVSGSGFFFGYDPSVPYGGDTTGFHDTVYNCMMMGWRQGLAITNTVFFTVRNCNFESNVLHSVLLAHADTARLENNNYGFPVVYQGDQSAIYVAKDVSGGAGAGVLSVGGECGNSACFVYVDEGLFKQIGGNFERNNVMLIANGLCTTSFDGCHIFNGTNAPFVFINGGGAWFWAGNCSLFSETTTIFDQRPGIKCAQEFPIHHTLITAKTNGLFNGAARAYPPDFYQTPRWSGNISLAQAGAIANATPLNFSNTSPAPFFSMDGLSISNTTAQIWHPMPYGLGVNANYFDLPQIEFTLMIQGGADANNASVTLTPESIRLVPATGYVNDYSPTYSIGGITNGAVKSFTWTQQWYDDISPRFLRLHVTTTNQIYLIGLTAKTIDY